MQKLSIVLLSLVANFNLVFWLMLLSGYSLSGTLWNLPATPIVGSVAAVLLSAFIVRVKQLALYRCFGAIRSPWHARLLLLLLPILFLAIGCLPLVLWIILLIGDSVLSQVLPAIDGHHSLSMIGSLVGIISGYTALVFFFHWVVSVLNQAALSKSVERAVYVLQAVSSMTLLAFVLSLFHSSPGEALCSKRYLSPSGQRSNVVEDYENDDGDFAGMYISRAYFNGSMFRKDLSDLEHSGWLCRQEPLTLEWSTDERHVHWKAPTNGQGHWHF